MTSGRMRATGWGGQMRRVVTIACLIALAGVLPASAAPGTAAPAASAAGDWTTYHRDNARTGYVAGAPDPTRLTSAWAAQLDGAVYAEPLVVGDLVLVATEGDTLYALDTASGRIVWHTNVGHPVPRGDLPCGDIDPLGITGTPVYDPATGSLFAVAEIQGGNGPAHILVALDARTGKLRWRRSADVPSMTQPETHQQRAALALANGRVYVAYGGLFGDCGEYHGTVVASRTDGQGSLLSFQVPTAREGAIWGASGPAVDAHGNLFVSTGNGEATSGAWDHTDSVLRLSPTLQLEDGFAPTTWQQDNAADLDLGSMGPALLPNGLVFADGKSGTGYLLDGNHLGGVGGALDSLPICSAFGGAATVGSTIYVPCTDGVRQVTVTSNRHLALGWQAPGDVTGSPIVGDHTVYALDPAGGTLFALNANDGSVRAQVNVGTATRFATPTLSGHRLFVGTTAGVVAVTLG